MKRTNERNVTAMTPYSNIGRDALNAAVVPGAECFLMRAGGSDRTYRISVAVPAGSPPAAGWPVIYALDGNAVFATMAEAMRVQSHRPEKSGVVPLVVVGIGYPSETAFDQARHYDFTLPVPLSELPAAPAGRAWPPQGGAEDFLRFIEAELKPEIGRRLPIDESRQALFGHSLGGFLVLHAMFTKPLAFRTYIAGSPSIHWNKRLLLEEERQFSARAKRESLPVQLLLAAGEQERSHPSRMNHNADNLHKRLAPLADHGVLVRYLEFADEGHLSVLPALISRAVRFASG